MGGVRVLPLAPQHARLDWIRAPASSQDYRVLKGGRFKGVPREPPLRTL